MTDQPERVRPGLMPPVNAGRESTVPDRTPPASRSKRPNVCERCGETIGVPADHLPNCTRSSAIVGVYLPSENALLDATGSTPVKFMLHADGTVSWRPLFGRTE